MDSEREMLDQYKYDDSYEYVRFLSDTFFPDYPDPEDICLDAELPPVDEIAKVVSSEEELADENTSAESFTPEELKDPNKKKKYYGTPGGFKVFKRIRDGKAEFLFTKKQYMSNTTIQDTIEAIGLDAEKLWHAILFIHHKAELENTNCRRMLPSMHDKMQDLISAIREERTSVRITIDRPGKSTYSLDDGQMLSVIADWIEYFDQFYEKLGNPTYTGKPIMIQEEAQLPGIYWHMYDEYLAYKKLFAEYCKDEKMPKRTKDQKVSRDKDLFISRLLFFTRVTTDQPFWDNRNSIRGVVQSCKTHKRPSLDSGFFW